MKTYYSLIFLLFSSLLSAQEFDEEFLRSLPANIRTDFEAQLEKDPELEEKYIPSPETRINNLEAALEYAQSTLKRIEDELSTNSLGNSSELKRFGENYFNSFQTTFVPLNEPNFNPNYILDFGDELVIQIVGVDIRDTDFRIRRDGTIIIPDVPPIPVSGLSLEKASELIDQMVSESLLGGRAYTSLNSLRDINVLIVGQAKKPGMYTLSGTSSVLSLLSNAGGINENGSYRNIQLKRDKKVIENIDLYDIFAKGDLSFDAQLRSGDVILVNSKLNEVRLSGSFANEAIFEFKSSDTLSDILQLAGPLNLTAQSTIAISRLENGISKRLEIVFSEADSFKLQHGDSIGAFNILPNFSNVREVILEGEVNTPGKYLVPEGSTILDIINLAGGYTSKAYPFGGIYLSQRAASLQSDSREKSYDILLRYLVSSPNLPQLLTASGGLVTFLGLIKNYEPLGRIQTEFNLSKLNKDSKLNRVLESGDKIIIPPVSNEIHVFGEVMNQGSFLYDPSLKPSDYLKIAGDLSKVADGKRIIIVDPNGNTRSLDHNYRFFFGSDVPLYPGSTIYVPRQLGKLDGIDLATNVAPIISSVALSLASLNSINN